MTIDQYEIMSVETKTVIQSWIANKGKVETVSMSGKLAPGYAIRVIPKYHDIFKIGKQLVFLIKDKKNNLEYIVESRVEYGKTYFIDAKFCDYNEAVEIFKEKIRHEYKDESVVQEIAERQALAYTRGGNELAVLTRNGEIVYYNSDSNEIILSEKGEKDEK